MQTAHIDPECILPVADGFVSEKGKIPSGAAVSFGHAVFSAELTGDGNTLLDGVENVPMFCEDVNAGDLHFFITAHGIADIQGLRRQGVLSQQMTAEGESVFIAPVGDFSDKVFGEKCAGKIIKIVPCLRNFCFRSKEEFGETVDQIIIVTFFEFRAEISRPRQTAEDRAVDVTRFIGEDGGNGF